MFRRVLWLVAALVFSAHATYGADEETALWKTVGNWSIYIDKTLHYRCFVAILYDNYSIFRMGFTEANAAAPLYVAIGNVNWSSIEDGKDYELVFQLDNQPGWKAVATGMRMNTVPALLVNTDQVKFVEEVVRKHALRVFFNGDMILNLSLRGSSAALNELAVCQKAVDAYLGNSDQSQQPQANDPFADRATPVQKRDPFDL